jgi:FAD/FMN-containing dehydrogenase
VKEDLEAHSCDVWPLVTKQAMQGRYLYVPDAVVRPADTGLVARVLAWASARGVPVIPWASARR